VFWDHGVNDLNASLDARLGSGAWPRQIARALATWEAVANLNIAAVPDGPYDWNTLGLAQGDPRFGDIRFGGYAFPNDTSTVAETDYPPPDGATAAGDVEINTAMNWNIGKDLDLYSAILHETGHALGLAHAQNPADVMDAVYQGMRTGLGPGDVAGIQAIYGARALDLYQAQGQGVSFASAIDVSGGLADSASTTVGNLSLAQIGGSEFFRVAAPSWSGSDLQVTAVAAGVSLLSPKVELYSSTGQLLAQAGDPTAWGDNVTASFHGVVPGQAYFVVVTGATGDVFDAGAYQLGVDFPGASVPAPTPAPAPPTAGPVGAPTSISSPNTNVTMASAAAIGSLSAPGVIDVAIVTSHKAVWYKFQAVRAGIYTVQAPGAAVTLFSPRAKRVAAGFGSLGLRVTHKGMTIFVKVSSPNGAPVADETLTITAQTVRVAMAHPGLRARPDHARPLSAASLALGRI
jgi:hypothetical protein